MNSRRAAPRGYAGHADLVRVAAALRTAGGDVEAGLAEAAWALGYARLPARSETAAEPGQPAVEGLIEVMDRADAPTPRAGSVGVPLWQPIAFTWYDKDPAARDGRDAAALDDADDEVERASLASHSPPQTAPLTPRSRLVPLLQQSLGTHHVGRALDVGALVARWARGVDVRKLPRRPRLGWPVLVLLLDRSFHLVPFWDDQLRVCELLAGLVGRAALIVRFTEGDPNGPFFDGHGRRADLRDGTLAGLPVLALTDLGWYGGLPTSRAWLRLGRELRRAGERLLALVPVPPARWTRQLVHVWTPMAWERPIAGASMSAAELATRADRLLDLAATARRLEPGLLRALRLLLPCTEADVGTEADAWMHEDIAAACADATLLRSGRAQARRERFRWAQPELRRQVAAALRRWHWHRDRRPEVWHTEALLLAADGSSGIDEATLARAEEFMVRLGRRARADDLSGWNDALRWWLEHTSEHAQALFDRSTAVGRGLQRAWQSTHEADHLPPDADPRILASMDDGEPVQPQRYVIRHVGDMLELGPAASVSGSQVGHIWAAAPYVYVVGSGRAPSRVLLTRPSRIAVESAEALELRTDCATLSLQITHKPAWARYVASFGRDRHGMWFDLVNGIISLRMRWIPPGIVWGGSKPELVIARGYWLSETAVSPTLWQAVMGERPGHDSGPDDATHKVSQEQARSFIERLEGMSPGDDEQCFRLPTAAEWDYARRAGGCTITGRSDPRRHDAWGLRGMFGEVAEWCSDAKPEADDHRVALGFRVARSQGRLDPGSDTA